MAEPGRYLAVFDKQVFAAVLALGGVDQVTVCY
jgi:hypothetical protein